MIVAAEAGGSAAITLIAWIVVVIGAETYIAPRIQRGGERLGRWIARRWLS